MSIIIVDVPMIEPIQIDETLWLVPCSISIGNEFVPILPPPAAVKNHHHHNWSEQEDAIIQGVIDTVGSKWTTMAHEVNKQLYDSKCIVQPRHCRERWFNYLDPALFKGPWTDEEDLIILETQQMKGNRWSKIAKALPGRNENSVKNRWKSLLRRARNKFTNSTD